MRDKVRRRQHPGSNELMLELESGTAPWLTRSVKAIN